MTNFMTGIYNFVTSYGPYIYMLAAASIVVVGVMFIIPSDEIHKKAIKLLPFVLIGVGIVLGATTFAREISATFTF